MKINSKPLRNGVATQSAVRHIGGGCKTSLWIIDIGHVFVKRLFIVLLLIIGLDDL